MTTDLERSSVRTRNPAASACEPYRNAIAEALSLGRSATAIWQDLPTEHGFEASYRSVERFARKLCGEPSREAHPTIQTEPGEEAQVDYGRDPSTGKYRRTRLFVLTLGFSRKSLGG